MSKVVRLEAELESDLLLQLLTFHSLLSINPVSTPQVQQEQFSSMDRTIRSLFSF